MVRNDNKLDESKEHMDIDSSDNKTDIPITCCEAIQSVHCLRKILVEGNIDAFDDHLVQSPKKYITNTN